MIINLVQEIKACAQLSIIKCQVIIILRLKLCLKNRKKNKGLTEEK